MRTKVFEETVRVIAEDNFERNSPHFITQMPYILNCNKLELERAKIGPKGLEEIDYKIQKYR